MSLYDDDYGVGERVQDVVLNCTWFATKDENMCKLISEKCSELNDTLTDNNLNINIRTIKEQIQELYNGRKIPFFNKINPTLLIIALYINNRNLNLNDDKLFKILNISKFDVARYMYLINEVSRTSSNPIR
jgi:transcription initiation factor IIE alpha subunit